MHGCCSDVDPPHHSVSPGQVPRITTPMAPQVYRDLVSPAPWNKRRHAFEDELLNRGWPLGAKAWVRGVKEPTSSCNGIVDRFIILAQEGVQELSHHEALSVRPSDGTAMPVTLDLIAASYRGKSRSAAASQLRCCLT